VDGGTLRITRGVGAGVERLVSLRAGDALARPSPCTATAAAVGSYTGTILDLTGHDVEDRRITRLRAPGCVEWRLLVERLHRRDGASPGRALYGRLHAAMRRLTERGNAMTESMKRLADNVLVAADDAYAQTRWGIYPHSSHTPSATHKLSAVSPTYDSGDDKVYVTELAAKPLSDLKAEKTDATQTHTVT
jgi:hypothetical protein